MSTNLHRSIKDEIVKKEKASLAEIDRLAFIGGVLDALMTRMPHTLNEYFALSDIWTGYTSPPAESQYVLRLQTKEGIADEEVAQAFGTIVKVAATLLGLGWHLEPNLGIAAAQWTTKHLLDVQVVARHPSPPATKLSFFFLHLPESERCKLVEEQILVPAKYETKLRVECEGDPVRLVDSPPVPLAAVTPEPSEVTR